MFSMGKTFFWLATLSFCLFGLAQDEEGSNCTIEQKQYNPGSFSPDDFLSPDGALLLDDSIRLDTDRELDLETLVLGLDQPFLVDYLEEGAGASHLFGFFFFDIDTDKDGLPDFFETGPTDDLDGDGLVNEDDDDDDNDGIPDSEDTVPSGVTSMPATAFRLGRTAADNGLHADDYWQFVPNSTIEGGTYDGYFELPGTYLYIDNNSNSIPDVLEYDRGDNKLPPYALDKGYTTDLVTGGTLSGMLGNWSYSGTPGDTVDDSIHWIGSTIYYLADDDGGTDVDGSYTSYTPYGNLFSDVYGSANGWPDYNIYRTTDITSALIPDRLKNSDGTAKTDNRDESLWRYRWYKANISGARELVFFLVVFYNNGGASVHTYYSKSAFNQDAPPGSYGSGTGPTRNGATSGDAYGGSSTTNWFPQYRNEGDHDALVQAVFGVDKWSDVATIPNQDTPPQLLANPASPLVTQEWIDQYQNWNWENRIIQYRALADWFSESGVDADTIIDGRYGIDMSAENDSSLIRATDGQMVHLMVGAPQDTRDAWLLGWEDLYGGGDRDFEDVAFYVKREAGGQVQSLNVAQSLQDRFEDFSLSQITFTFMDNFTDDLWGVEGRYINYYYRLGNADDWICLLCGQHERSTDIFHEEFGGETTEEDDVVTRTVTIQVENKKQEIYWKVEMATDNVDTFSPKVFDAIIDYQSLVHDFYFNSAIIPSSNINYIANHETPDFSWEESRNRGHLYALKTFEHGNPPDPVQVADGASPELTPTTQPAQPFQWDAGVTMKTALDEGTERTIYSWIADNPDGVHSSILTMKTLARTEVDSDVVASFNLTSERPGGIWLNNFHDPGAAEQDKDSASLWLQNWIHGYSNPLVSEGDLVDSGPTREWVLGGINRSSPLVIRTLGIPNWLLGTGVPVATKREYLQFIDQDDQSDLNTRILIGADSGLVYCLDAGKWVGKAAIGEPPDEEEFEFADGHYASDNFGDGSEVWALLPGNLLDDIKFNYTGANSVTAKVDATGISTAIRTTSGWKRIVVYSQGYKGGTESVGGSSLIGNVVWALDITNPDLPKAMWERREDGAADLVNPPAIGWAEIGGSNEWVVAYSTGGTPTEGVKPGFYIVRAETGVLMVEQGVGSDDSIGKEVMLGTPALLDSDGNGYVDLLFGATSEGKIFAYDMRDSTLSDAPISVLSNGFVPRFFLTPNVQAGSGGKVTLTAVSGDNPLLYDHDDYSSSDFNNYVFVFTYDPEADGTPWEEQLDVNGERIVLPDRHKAFSRPKLVGTQLVLGTTTGDTFNFCDFDPDDPGDLLLVDINNLEIEDSISNYGSILAPIIVSDARVFAHSTTSDRNDPNELGSVFRVPEDQVIQSESVKRTVIAEVFGVIGWQDDLIKKISP